MTRRRASIITACVVALLLGSYAAAGYLWAPRLVHDALTERAAQRGLQLRIGAIRTDPFALRVELDGITLSGSSNSEPLAEAPKASADLTWSSLWQRVWVIERVRVERLMLRTTQLAGLRTPPPGGGELPPLVLRELLVDDASIATGAPYPPLTALRLSLRDASTLPGRTGRCELSARWGEGRLTASGELARDDGRWTLRAVAIDGQAIRQGDFALSEVRLRTPVLTLPLSAPIELQADVTVEPGATLSAHGQVVPQPLRADLQLDARTLPLRRFASWLPARVGVDVESGTLSGSGHLRLAARADGVDGGYDGSAVLAGLRIVERGSRQLLVAWQRLEAGDLRVAFPRPSLQAGSVKLHGAEARIAIGPQGELNWAQVVAAPAQTSIGATPASPPWRIGSLQIDDGTLHVSDRSLETPFETTVQQLAGSITNLARPSAEPAGVQLDGRIEGQGSASIRGTIDLDRPLQLADIAAQLRDVPLPAFSPYAARFAGYRIRAGQVSARLHYELRNGDLHGRNDVVLQRLQLGEKVQQRGAADIPLDLAVALLTDANGRIGLDIPVTGNLNDPKVDFAGLVAKAIGNALRKVVTAPFRALASLGRGRRGDQGSGGELSGDGDTIAFDPGDARLAPEAQRGLAQVAKLLLQRPQLKLSVRGRFDPSADVPALRRRAVQREIAREARLDETTAPDLSDAAVRAAAERLYLRKVGGRLELQALRRAGGDYAAALVERLANALPPSSVDPSTLARRRAEAIVAVLVGQGVAASRVRIEGAEATRGAEGMTAQLSLGLA